MILLLILVKIMEEKLSFEVGKTMIFLKGGKERKKERKWNGKGTRQERKRHLLKRNEAGTKTSFIEKERGRNEIICSEERLIP